MPAANTSTYDIKDLSMVKDAIAPREWTNTLRSMKLSQLQQYCKSAGLTKFSRENHEGLVLRLKLFCKKGGGKAEKVKTQRPKIVKEKAKTAKRQKLAKHSDSASIAMKERESAKSTKAAARVPSAKKIKKNLQEKRPEDMKAIKALPVAHVETVADKVSPEKIETGKAQESATSPKSPQDSSGKRIKRGPQKQKLAEESIVDTFAEVPSQKVAEKIILDNRERRKMVASPQASNRIPMKHSELKAAPEGSQNITMHGGEVSPSTQDCSNNREKKLDTPAQRVEALKPVACEAHHHSVAELNVTGLEEGEDLD